MSPQLTVDVWLGLFSCRARMENYLEEVYDDDDSTPLSEFAGDMDESFYDHDFFESSFYETPTQELRTPLSEHSLGTTGIEQVVATFEKAPIPFNSIFLMWNEDDYLQITSPVSVAKEGVQLKYLGRFDGEMRK